MQTTTLHSPHSVSGERGQPRIGEQPARGRATATLSRRELRRIIAEMLG